MSGRSLRIAFVTPEFVTEPRSGGLGSYLERICRALRDAGHRPEVFTLSGSDSETIDAGGVAVHRVRRAGSSRAIRAALRLLRWVGLRGLQPALVLLADALRLARALRRREAERPFDLVQSSDYLAAGLFVARSPRRPHLVRCSSACDLLARANGEASPRRWWQIRLERACILRADAAYAPSRFVAEHLSERAGVGIGVVRPPALLEVKPEPDRRPGLPPRYFVHFGQLVGAKGTRELARALPRVWAEEPDFTMVWAGSDRRHPFESWAAGWGPRHRARVLWLGELPRCRLYSLLRGADAAVLPSRVDNLPNTVIECLMLGVPVIGSAGASIDELIEPGVTGELVPVGDADALAEAMLRAWRGEWSVRRGFRWTSDTAASMRPARAVENLLRLAGLVG